MNVLDEDKRQQVLALGRMGSSLRRIEHTTGVRRETASAYLKAAGVAVRGRGGWRGEWPAKAAITPEVSTDPDSSKPAIPAEVSTDSGRSKPATTDDDRLLHHAHVLKCGPRSWRTKVHTDLRQEVATR